MIMAHDPNQQLRIYHPPGAPDVISPLFEGLKHFATDHPKIMREAQEGALKLAAARQSSALHAANLRMLAMKERNAPLLAEAQLERMRALMTRENYRFEREKNKYTKNDKDEADMAAATDPMARWALTNGFGGSPRVAQRQGHDGQAESDAAGDETFDADMADLFEE